MKVLIIAHKPPYPPKDGGCLAIYNVALGLFQSNIDVEVFCVETDKHPFKLEDAKNIPFKISSGYVDTRLKPIAALKSLIKDKSYNISRFYCKIFERKLVKKLQSKNYDIVQLETLFVTPYIQTIKNNSNSKIVYRSHNVEYKIWKHLAQGEKKLIKKSYLNKLTKQLKSYEYSTLNKYDGAAFITEIDRK